MKLFPSLKLFTGLSQKPQKFLPSFPGSAGLTVLPPNSYCSFRDNKEENEEYRDGSHCTSRYAGLWGGDGFRDVSQGPCLSSIDEDEYLQDTDQAIISRKCLSKHCSKIPPLRRRQVSVICQKDIGVIMMNSSFVLLLP